MTCTGARLAAFFAMDSQLSVPRDVRRSPTKMLTRYRLLTIVGLTVTLAVAACVIVMPTLTRHMVREHQQNVILEFDRWADEHSIVTDRETAIRAAGMIDYISNYYPPGDGYRSDSETERRLADARRNAMSRIANALSAYTGTVMAHPLDWPAELCDNTAQVLRSGEPSDAPESPSRAF